MKERENTEEIAESLSQNECKILPYIEEENVTKVIEKSGVNKVSVLRALEFLSNKEIITISNKKRTFVELGLNGILYKKEGLPERRLANILSEGKSLSLEEAKSESKLSDNEFKAAIGALKKRALANLSNGRLVFSGNKTELTKKTLEEQLLEILPTSLEDLRPEQKFALESLKNRKEIIEINTRNEIEFKVTPLGKKLSGINLNQKDLVEAITPEIIRSGSWKGKKFRRYDIKSPVPRIYGGKKHFVNQAIEYGRKVWLELGFKEMSGPIIQTGFWNFDALFTAQDHPVREMQDTFFIKNVISKLPDTKLVAKVKKAHETGVGESKGWQYSWKEEDAKKVVLRTHTTCLSARTLSSLKPKDLPAKFFSIGKCFRNETVDWSHGFEFYQTEGIVVDKDATFLDLLGYLKEFYKKMGFDKIRFTPSYFPYTEPSVEISVYHPEKKIWLEVGGAGIFRPEMVIPLFGEYIPVLAWGQGFDRIIMDYYAIKDLREMYKNNLTALRNKKAWMRT